MTRILVTINLKNGVHDPQAEAVQHALHDMGFDKLTSMTMGKQMVLEIDEEDHQKALTMAEDMCRQLLANTVLERFEAQVQS